jgi:hypothetical protein
MAQDKETDEIQSKNDTSVEKENALTDWDNEPTVADLKLDLSDAKHEVDNHILKVDRWLENLNITGSAKINNGKNRSSIVPQLIRKQAEWRYASLSEPFLSTSDLFDVDPITHEDKPGAYQNSLMLNNQFNTKIDKVRFIDDFVRTAVDEGTAIVRVGWDFEDEIVEVEVPDFELQPTQDPQIVQVLQQLLAQVEADPESMKGLPPEQQQRIQLAQQGQATVAVEIGSHIEEQTNIIRNCPTLEVCNYKNLSIDPTCQGDLSKASFVIYSFESSLSQLKKDGKYENLDDILVETNSVLNEPDHHSNTTDSSFSFSDEPRKKIVVQEYWGHWDIDGDGVTTPIVAAWVGDTKIRMEVNPFPDQQHPFVAAQYLPVRRSVYGEPDGQLLEDNQKIVGAVTRGMIDIMGRSANGQQGVRKDALDITNKRKFDKGVDYEYNGQVDPRLAFHMHTYPEIPQSAQFMLAMQNNEAESLTGVKAFSGPGGITGAALGENVGGIKSAMDAASKRELGILRRLASTVKTIGHKIISMNAEFLSEEEVVRVTNEEFVTIRRDDLGGKFDLKLSISTPEADEAKAKELAFMLQTTGQTMGPAFSQIILSDIAKLRKMPDLAKRIQEYQPQPNPQQEEMAVLEMELLKAKIAVEMSKANENNAEAELDRAKMGNINSDTDQKDLDFLEQESGASHAKSRELGREKATMDLEGKLIQADQKKEIDLENAFAANTNANSQ